MKYIELAASKDSYRPLTQVYRTACGKLVATDGHRMHWSNGLELIEKGHYVDFKDYGEFPDVNQVIPSGECEEYHVTFDKKDLSKLKTLAKLLKEFDRTDTAFKLEGKDGALWAKQDGELTLGFKLCELENKAPFEIKLNVNYFIDAIEMNIKDSGLGIFTFEFRGSRDPFLIKSSLGNALIMPLRD
jgi:DNA polymerase III sliding clamp (beta) subunit (PCNA family)